MELLGINVMIILPINQHISKIGRKKKTVSTRVIHMGWTKKLPPLVPDNLVYAKRMIYLHLLTLEVKALSLYLCYC
jgi:hypothetical protein